MQRVAILCGNDAVLMESRAAVIRSAAITVETRNGLSSLTHGEIPQGMGLLVLCHSLSLDEQRAAFEWFRGQRPTAKVIVLTAGAQPSETPPLGECLSTHDGPQALVNLSLKLLVQ